MINILVIDQKRLFSEGIAAFLEEEEDLSIIGIKHRLSDVKTVLKKETIHVVLINILLQTIDGIEFTIFLKANYPDIKIIHYTSKADDELIIKSIYNGAHCIVLESVNPEHFIHSIRAVVAGEKFFSGEIAKVLAERVLDFEFDEKVKLQRQTNRLNIELTQRRLDVAILVKKGYTNKCIAEKLGLSEGTVKNYVSDLYRIFNKNTRKELIEFIRNL